MCGVVAVVPSYDEGDEPKSVQVRIGALPDVADSGWKPAERHDARPPTTSGACDAKRLIAGRPHSRRYDLAPDNCRVVFLFTKTYGRALTPAWRSWTPPHSPMSPPEATSDRHGGNCTTSSTTTYTLASQLPEPRLNLDRSWNLSGRARKFVWGQPDVVVWSR